MGKRAEPVAFCWRDPEEVVEDVGQSGETQLTAENECRE